MDPLSLVIEALRAVVLLGAGALWAGAVAPRGRDPRHRWRVRLASASLAALVAGSVLFGPSPAGVIVLALGTGGLLVAVDDHGVWDALTRPEGKRHATYR